MAEPSDPRAELDRLLPFYANGTLDPVSRARVEAALAQSPDLRAALAEQQEIRGMVRQAADGWSDGAGLIPPGVAPRADAPEVGALAFLAPSNWRPAVVLGLAALIAVQAVGLALQHRRIGSLEQQNYELASGKGQPGGKGAILIELQEGARWNEVAALLDSEALRVVGSGDFGVLSLASDKQGADLQAQIERLRKNPLIASADPAA
jgi:hypothetical protein